MAQLIYLKELLMFSLPVLLFNLFILVILLPITIPLYIISKLTITPEQQEEAEREWRDMM